MEEGDRQRAPSLDKIIPSLGYTKENTHIICLRCNVKKADMTPEEMYRIADYVYKVRKERGLDARVQDREEVP